MITSSFAFSLLLLLINGSLCLPIEQPIEQSSGSGMAPNNTAIDTIDCSLPVKLTDLEEINAGLTVVGKYVNFGVKAPRSFCIPPINIVNLQPITRYITAPQVNSPQFIAKWYTVFASYNKYLSILQPSITDEEQLSNLTTLRSLLTSLEQSYLTVLQDRLCNCTEDCVIPPIIEHTESQCNESKLNYVFFMLNNLIPEARDTLDKFIGNCECQSPNVTTTFRHFV